MKLQNTPHTDEGSKKAGIGTIFEHVGVFLGVSLVAWSLLDFTSTYWLMILGVLLSPISLIIHNKEKVSNKTTEGAETKQKYLQLFLVYSTSTLGVGLITGSVLSFDKNYLIFMTLIIIGSVLSLLSRYNFKKQKILGVIEDFILYLLIHLGIVILVFGLFKMTLTSALPIILSLMSILLTPYLLLSRERAILKKKYYLSMRKYLVTIVVVLGLGFTVLGLINLLVGGWLLVPLLFVGVLCLLAGVIVDKEHSLVSIKDIL